MSERISRRAFVGRSTTAAAGMLLGGGALGHIVPKAPAVADASTAGELSPTDPIAAIFAAVERYPIVAIAELHFLQEWHDLITALLFHPQLPSSLTHIVVEFGNAQYQEVADRLVLGDEPVAKQELANIWRFQGWDQPVYEQFIRNVRAVNWMRRPSQPIRVLLGAPALDVWRVRRVTPAFTRWWRSTPDIHMTSVIEREVLARGGHALLLAGAGHVLRGIYADNRVVNAATRLAQTNPGAIYCVDTVAIKAGRQAAKPGPQADPTLARLQSTVANWPRPALALLAGTWLGTTKGPLASRATSPSYTRYEAEADAILHLGPGQLLTASQADPTLFETGPYHAQLRRINPLVSQIDHTPEDLITESLRWANATPDWFSQFGE